MVYNNNNLKWNISISIFDEFINGFNLKSDKSKENDLFYLLILAN